MSKFKHIIHGPVDPAKLGDLLEKHQTKTAIGAHVYFLGQVRADQKAEGKVEGIEYSAYEAMAEQVMHEIKEEAFVKFDITCAHIFHSTGLIKKGECSLLVMVSSAHRNEAYAPLQYIVEEIKKRVPVWKKEILDNGQHIWVDGAPT